MFWYFGRLPWVQPRPGGHRGVRAGSRGPASAVAATSGVSGGQLVGRRMRQGGDTPDWSGTPFSRLALGVPPRGTTTNESSRANIV